jgi:hypothetical protein
MSKVYRMLEISAGAIALTYGIGFIVAPLVIMLMVILRVINKGNRQ